MRAICFLAPVLCLAFLPGVLCAGGEAVTEAEKEPEPILTIAALDSIGELSEGVQIEATPLGSIGAMTAALVKLTSVRSHYHVSQAELVYILEGSGTLVVGANKVYAVPGTTALIPAGVPHSFKADGEEPCLVLSVKAPPSDGSDTIYVD